MHVVKGHYVAALERCPVEVVRYVPGFRNFTNRHMPRYDGVGNAGEVPLVQVYIGSAHLACNGFDQDPAFLNVGIRNVPYFYG